MARLLVRATIWAVSMSMHVNARPAGRRRGTAFVVVMSIVTFGFYTWYWAFKTHDEMQQHTGRGVGGVVGLVIWILISPVSAFVIPAEVAGMHTSAGRAAPVSGWTGLWLFPFGFLIIPAIVWFVKVQGALNRYWESKGATS